MPTTPPPTTIDYDQFVDTRIKQTRTAVKVTDLASGIATLLAAGLAFLLVAALVEHWLVPGGFSTGERAGLLGVVLVGGVIYSARRLLPVIVGRVNPLYAAIEIERDAPELKNSLVNLLQLRSSGATSKVIQQTLEQQAAERLASSSEATIDREGLLRIGYVLLGLVAVIGLYVVISPKDFFATAGRIALPWADIAAPTRVQIMDVTPGAATVSQGDTIEVSARLSGLQEDDIVELIYSARDGRTIDRRVTMQTDESGIRYRALLGGATGSGLGLQTNVQYRLAAGDARSPLYRVQVLSSPTIAPVSVTYDYPDYTGYVDRTIEGAGDLEAIEGTRVKLTVEANLAIESAQIDLDADGTPDIRLRADGQNAIASFTLRRDGERTGMPRESVYVIRFTSEDGQTNTDPARHHLLVKPDLVPEAAILLPKEETMDVALNGEVEIEIEARDPDFALASVRLLGEVKGRNVLKDSLLGRSKKGHTGKFFVRQTLSPELLGLSVGDVLTYWVEATDNRSPEANRVVTTRKRLRVVDSETKNGKAGDPQEGQQDGQQGEASEDPTQGNETGEEGNEGDSSSEDSLQQPGENDQQENGNPQSSATGDQQQEGQQPEGQQGEQQQNQQQQGEQEQGQQGEQQQAEEADPDGGSQADPPPGGIQGNGKENPDSKSGDGQQGGAAGESSGDDKKEGNGGDSGADQSGENPSGNDSQTGERRPGTPTGGDQQPVAQDGSDDGEAFDRMRQHMADEGAEEDADEGPQKNGDGESIRKDSEQDSGKGQPSEGDSSEQGDAAADETGEVHHGTEDSADQLNDSHADSPERSVDGEAPEGGTSGQQSDSQSSEQGESGGDESSTEETTTPHDGTGSTGQSQAADEGSGQSADQGAGDRSGQAGGEQVAEESTGQSSGDQPGQGSQTGEGNQPGEREEASSDGSTGDQTGDGNTSSNEGTPSESGETPAADSQGQNGSPSSANGRDGQENNQRRDPNDKRDPSQGNAPGGERDRDSQLPDDDKLGGEPGGDEANLDYARKQTDLVLKRLSEQLDKNAVDKELLEKLGWTEEDLRRFVSRWQDRQEQAATGDDRGKSELNSALRSLGLDRKGPTATGTLKKDQLRDLRQRTRTTIPPALRDRLRPYNRGVSASREE